LYTFEKQGVTIMALKDACGCASVVVLMFGAITTSAVAGAVREGRAWNRGQPYTHTALGHSHHVRHNLARGSREAGALPVAAADLSVAPHFVRVGPNGYWVTSSWGCSIDEAQDRIVDCDGANR
jgi:hypothetical protein